MLNIWRNILCYVPEFDDWIIIREFTSNMFPLLSGIYSRFIKQSYLEDIAINQSENRIRSCA